MARAPLLAAILLPLYAFAVPACAAPTGGRIPSHRLSGEALTGVAATAASHTAKAAPITSIAAAEAALERHGLQPIAPLTEVGDYWQGRARENGKTVRIFLFDNGRLWVRTEPEVMLKAVEGPGGRLHLAS